jgi:hypothetical protein
MAHTIPSRWDFPVPEQLYPVPQLTLVREQGRILRVLPPEKAQMAEEILQLGMVFHEDQDHPPAVVTGVADAIRPGQEGQVRRWIDQLVLQNKVVLVFLHTVVKGPIRFVATDSPQLVAALAQPVNVMQNYAVLDGPEYLIRQAQQLAQGGKATWTLPHAQQVNSFMDGKASEEGSLSPFPDVGSGEPKPGPSTTLITTEQLAWLAAGILVTSAVTLYILRKA